MFNRLKIASKLFIGFGALLVLLVAVSSLSAFSGLKSKVPSTDLARQKNNELTDQRFEKRFFEARMHIWMALGSGDQEQWKQSDEPSNGRASGSKRSPRRLRDPGRRAKVRAIGRVAAAIFRTWRASCEASADRTTP